MTIIPSEEEIAQSLVPTPPPETPPEVVKRPEVILEDLPELTRRLIMRNPSEDYDERLVELLLEVEPIPFEPVENQPAYVQDWCRHLELDLEDQFKLAYACDFSFVRKKYMDRLQRALQRAPESWCLTYDTPWNRLVHPNGDVEPELAYTNFKIYLNYGVNRTLAKACKEAKGNIVHYREWSEKWLWDVRAICYDRFVADDLTAKLPAVKAQALYKSHETLIRLQEYNNKVLDHKLTDEENEITGNLLLTHQTETFEQATKLHAALFGSKQEVKADIGISLAHAILTAAPETIDI
jgi:hypothetical protein